MEPTSTNIPETETRAGLQFGESEERVFMSAISKVFGLGPNVGRAEYAASVRRRTFGGRRDLMKVCGWNESPTYADFWVRYERQDIAGRVIDLPVDQTWGGGDLQIEGWPEWPDFNRRLKVQARLTELDRLASIGEFSILLFGIAQQGDGDVDTVTKASVEQTMLEPVTSIGSLDDILYLQQYPRNTVEIDQTDSNPMSPRFGKPEVYKITIKSQSKLSEKTESAQYTTLRVHWTRVLHIAPNTTLSDLQGRSRLLRILDRLHDLDKVVGGSAEMFWQGADRPIILNRNAGGGSGGVNVGSTETKADLRAQAEEWAHGLRRILMLTNGEVSTLPPNSPDPSGIVRVLIQLIAAGSDIPYRILVGSEQGQLASTQDRSNFADTIANRRTNFAQPSILVPFVDRLNMWSAAPESSTLGYFWPPIEILSADEKSTVDERKVNAMKRGEEAFALGGQVFDANDYRRTLGFEELSNISGNNPGAPEAVDVDENDDEVQAQFERSRRSAAA